MRAAAILMATLLAWATLATAQEGPKSPSPQPTPTTPAGPTTTTGRVGVLVSGGAYVGEVAPDFELDGSKGQSVRLSRLRGDWVVLVFTDRRMQLTDLATVAADLKLLGGVFLGVCAEKARTIEKAQEKNPLPFTVLADPTHEVSAMYGVYDRVHSATSPGCFVLDRRGVVRLSVLGQVVPPEQVLELAKIPIGATQ